MISKFLIAQLFGIIAIIINILCIHFNSKEKILKIMIISNILVTIQFFLLNAITGGVVSIINTIRCYIFYLYKKNNKKKSVITLILFEIIYILSGIISWQNIWSIFPIIATVTCTYGLWQDNILITKIIYSIVGIEWLVYDIVVKAYAGIIQSIMQTISSAIAAFKYKKINKRA